MATHTKFPDVPDFSDPGFNRNSPTQYAEAQYQRVREMKVAVEEMKVLQEKLFRCYYQHAPDHYSKCKDLVTEYKARVQMTHNIPPVGYESASRLRRSEDGGLVFERK